jgi:hypothetical protein
MVTTSITEEASEAIKPIVLGAAGADVRASRSTGAPSRAFRLDRVTIDRLTALRGPGRELRRDHRRCEGLTKRALGRLQGADAVAFCCGSRIASASGAPDANAALPATSRNRPLTDSPGLAPPLTPSGQRGRHGSLPQSRLLSPRPWGRRTALAAGREPCQRQWRLSTRRKPMPRPR